MRPTIVIVTSEKPPEVPQGVSCGVADVPDDPYSLRGVTVIGEINTDEEAAAVLAAVVRGAAASVTLGLRPDLAASFLDQARRIADVASTDRSVLADDERGLLELLRKGLSVRSAAAALGISTRTADRRLAVAREVLGVSTTAEAIAALPRR